MNNHDKLLNYMFGFYTGAGCKAIDPKRAPLEDFQQGLKDGREAKSKAYKQASKHYGVELAVIKAAKY